MRIASAFLGAGDEIVSWVGQNPKRRVEIIVRLEYPTNPDSVASLLNHPQVSIRAADPARTPFHEKLFLAIDSAGEPVGAYIGSANWTQGGLRKNREAGVWVSEQGVLREMAAHFSVEYQVARKISEQMLAELRADFLWQESHGKRPSKDRGTLVSSWRALGAARDGRFLLKQGGVSTDPFVEGRDELCERVRNHSSQTFGEIPSTIEEGMGIIVSLIARRRDGSPDRVIYGRGRIAGIDRERWRLPDRYLDALARKGLDPKKIKHVRRWPDILWLDPAEYINYSRGFKRFLWLSDYLDDPSFQLGFRWIPADAGNACNKALDEHTDKFGLLPVDRQGIWWNRYLGIQPGDPLFMTKARIEEMNLARG